MKFEIVTTILNYVSNSAVMRVNRSLSGQLLGPYPSVDGLWAPYLIELFIVVPWKVYREVA